MRVRLYIEGGGSSAEQQGRLRAGFTELFARARNRKSGFTIIPCGSRDEAHNAFLNAAGRAAPNEACVLLVDSEDPLPPGSAGIEVARRDFLLGRERHWRVGGVPPDRIHLMVQTMETWIVADPDALSAYYGQGFLRNALPPRTNLEKERKVDVCSALERATRPTQKGAYAKINHASQLLTKIDPMKVAARCPHFGILIGALDRMMASGS